jgi:hypothetical protein
VHFPGEVVGIWGSLREVVRIGSNSIYIYNIIYIIIIIIILLLYFPSCFFFRVFSRIRGGGGVTGGEVVKWSAKKS